MRARYVIILWYMFYMLSINALCYDAILYCMGPSWEPSLWGPSVSFSINTLWQPERLTLTSVCSEMISYMLSCNYYSHMMLCSPCYRSMLNATMRYCIVWGPYGNRRYGDQHMGTIDMGTIDIRRYQYNDIHRYIQLCVIACLGVGGVHMYHHSRQVRVGLRYCDTYQLRLCVRSVVAITLSCNCCTESW
jgi:hypothetical protein